MEFDGISMEKQVDFWTMMLAKNYPVACLIHSGSKSIHGWIYVNVDNAETWTNDIERKLYDKILVPLGGGRSVQERVQVVQNSRSSAGRRGVQVSEVAVSEQQTWSCGVRILRVFPRRTNATPDDDNVRVGMPGLFDECDEVHISVAFDWDKDYAEEMAFQWERIAPVKLGGVAYDDPGGDFTPGMYIKKGYVITSRGCPNKCWFCEAWKNEGVIRELPITDGHNLLDNNILACSDNHQREVFNMLRRQTEKPLFTGGLDAAFLEDWHMAEFKTLNIKYAYFAYDTPDDYDSLTKASRMLRIAGLLKGHTFGCYVLVGHKGDSFEKAEKRLRSSYGLGFFPAVNALRHGEVSGQ